MSVVNLATNQAVFFVFIWLCAVEFKINLRPALSSVHAYHLAS